MLTSTAATAFTVDTGVRSVDFSIYWLYDKYIFVYVIPFCLVYIFYTTFNSFNITVWAQP